MAKGGKATKRTGAGSKTSKAVKKPKPSKSVEKPANHATDQQAPPRTTLLTLPPELKNKIYVLVLAPSPTTPIPIRSARNKVDRTAPPIKRRRRQTWREPALLRVNRQLRAEALPLYYGSNVFVLSVFMEDFTPASAWVRSVVRAVGATTAFGALGFVVQGSAWGKLEELRPLVRLIGEVGGDLARGRVEGGRVVVGPSVPQGMVVEMQRNTGEWIRGVFEEVLGLGRRAFGEGWGEEWLEWEFEGVVERARGSYGGKKAMAGERAKAAKKAAVQRVFG